MTEVQGLDVPVTQSLTDQEIVAYVLNLTDGYYSISDTESDGFEINITHAEVLALD